MAPLLLAFSTEVVRWGLVLILTLAVLKLGPRTSRRDLANTVSAGLKLPGAGLVAGSVPLVEGLVAVLLGFDVRIGQVASVLVFAALTLGVATLNVQPEQFNCACFGGTAQAITNGTVLRNGLLTGSALWLCLIPSQPRTSGTELAAGLSLAVAALLIASRRQLGFIVRGPNHRRSGLVDDGRPA